MSEFNVSTSGIPNGNNTPQNNNSEVTGFNHEETKNEPVNTGLQKQVAETTQSYLTEAEIKDPNSIIVEISTQSPIVVLFGTPSSGKTMALIRLTRYLRENGFNVEPVRDFRPTNSAFYQECCDEFDNFVNSDVAPPSTGKLNFLLLNVTKNGNSICQILEAPGEHFFNKSSQNEEFPTYIHSVANNSLSKVWIFFLEKGWESDGIRSGYAKRITNLFGKVRSKDSIILLCNKADVQRDYIDGDKPMVSKFQRDINQLYPAIFEKLGESKGVFGKMFASKSYKSEFVVFSAGAFTSRQDGGKTFIAGSSYYPAKLWEAISRAVKGRWF